MYRFLVVVLVAGYIVGSIGCAGMKPPTPRDVMNNPLGTTMLKPGLAKEQVTELWGSPHIVTPLGYDELNQPREEWVYHGKMNRSRVDYQYLSEDQYLFFVGNVLVKMGESSIAGEFETEQE